jgi:putative FmdB family regulatory protein
MLFSILLEYKCCMPLYEYKCASCGKTFEVIQKFADEPLMTHPECGGVVERLFSAPAFHLKGTGWYATDYAKKSNGPAGTNGDKAEKSDKSEKSGDSKSDSAATTAPATETKPVASSDPKPSATP